MSKSTKKFRAAGSITTKPITRDQFDYILNEFADRQDHRMGIVCHLLYKCIRIGDVLKTLTIQDIYNSNGGLKDKLDFKEQKTKKQRLIPMAGDRFLNSLKNYWPQIKTFNLNDPLFYSTKTKEPLQDSGVKFLLRQFNGKRGIVQCSPHSFRKGGSKEMYLNNVRIEAISNVLNHANTRVTEIYIDITPKDIEESMACLAI